MMLNALIAAAAVSALLAIAVEWRERRHPSFYLLKPLTTLLITGIALLAPTSSYQTLVVAALLLSLAGDVCLMFEGNAWFMGGLGSFLLAHFIFVAAYLSGLQAVLPPWWAGLFLVYGMGFFLWLMPHTGTLKIPVMIYGGALMAMAVTASARWVSLHDGPALLALLGASVFVVSDSALAVRKFVGSYRYAQALILSTYWMGIGLIALSVHPA